MKTNTRRKFIRNSSLTATGLLLTSITKAKNDSVILSAIGCAPNQLSSLASTIVSVKSGKWSDPTTWGGKLPTDADLPYITPGHTVVYDLTSSNVAGLTISKGSTLKFDDSKSVTLQSSKNIIVQGNLEMLPSNIANIHLIRFINVDETKFVGGGHMVLDSDIGLWVIDAGRLNLVGTDKESWNNLSGSSYIGEKSISLKGTLKGWTKGDDIVVCPTRSVTGMEREMIKPFFERVKISDLSSNAVSIDKPLIYDHTKVAPDGSGITWTAEVLNLTRNVRIEGTATGKSHVFIKSSVPQTIKNVALRYLGPKAADIGRYALHFHHCFNGSIGSIVENCVAYDQGSHCFVPHTSHGITFKNCVAFDFLQQAYWWDEGHVTHYTVYDGCVAAFGTIAGFLLGMGDENVCNNCVCVGAAIGSGNANDTGGFFWEANNEGVWEFKNNLSHSNFNGLKVWQNTSRNHVIENYCSYNNMLAAFHGAYVNSYTYKYGYHYNSKFSGKATSSQSSGVRIENIIFDAAGNDYAAIYSDSPIETEGGNTNKFYNCTFKGYKIAPILLESFEAQVNADGTSSIFRKTKKYDLINCDLGGKMPLLSENVENGTVVRIQPKIGQPIKIEKVGLPDLSIGKIVISNIAVFTAKLWGEGQGLTGEYFNGTYQFEDSKKVISRIDSVIAFNEWSTSNTNLAEVFHHKLTSDMYTVCWTGKLQAQYSEDYILKCNAAGGVKLTINNEVLIDEWDAEPFNGDDRPKTTRPYKMLAGEFYDIKIEHCNRTGYRGFVLFWKSTSMSLFEIIPQCQLFPSNSIVSKSIAEEPQNIIPIAKAGEDVTITLPANQVKLDATGSSDADGKIVSYKWSKVNGPAQFEISKPSEAITPVLNLNEGEYIFELEIKDEQGGIAKDAVKVLVKPAIVNEIGLIAKAESDATINLPTNSISLNGSNSSHSKGKISNYNWKKVSGPSQYTISNSAAPTTSINNLTVGTYVFQLEVNDEEGNKATDDVTVTVNEAIANQKPIALAGDDFEIFLPTDHINVNAFASTDADGFITTYNWTKLSGPLNGIIENPNGISTTISKLVVGEYVFKLEVKDNKGAVASDEIKVKVNPKKVDVVLPRANAGIDQTVNLPGNNVKLQGEGINGSTGVISNYSWTKVSGPSKFKIVNPNSASTVVSQLVQGTYVFQLEVKDSNNFASKDEVTITVVGKETTNEQVSSNHVPDQLILSASPNPSPNIFNIHFNSNSDKLINLKLYDKWGVEVGNIKNVQKGSTVKIPGNLKRGTYYATAEQGFQKKTITLIKL